MRLKLISFFSLIISSCIAGLNIYDLSGSVEYTIIDQQYIKYADEKKIICWTDIDGDNKYHCRVALANGSGFDTYDLSGPVDNVLYQSFVINEAGQAAVFWIEGSNAPFEYKCSRWNGLIWITTTLDDDVVSVDDVKLAMDANGHIIVVWLYYNIDNTYHLEGALWNGLVWSIQDLDVSSSLYIYNLQAYIYSGMATIDWVIRDAGGPTYHMKAASWD